MSYDLRIVFSGLSMYVPQEANELMHVLLPATRHHAGHHGMEEHFTRLVYDAAYETPGSTQLSRTYIIRDFEGRQLDLRGLESDEGLEAHIPDEIPAMDGPAGKVDPTLVQDGALDPRLAGRVVLGSGALTDCLLGARFNLDGEERRITVRSEWTVRGITTEEDGPNGRRAVLPALQDAGLPALYPIGRTIHLMVFNTTAEEFPPNGPGFFVRRPQGDAHHFGVYYPLTVAGTGSEIPRRITARKVEVQEVGPPVVKKNPQALLGMTCVQRSASL